MKEYKLNMDPKAASVLSEADVETNPYNDK